MLQTAIKKISSKFNELRIRLLAPWTQLPKLDIPAKTLSPEPVVQKEGGLPRQLAWQGLLLQDDEIIVYKDDEGSIHYLSRHPIDKDKKYTILQMDSADLKGL